MIVLGPSLLFITYWLLVTLYITMIVLGLSLLLIAYWLLV